MKRFVVTFARGFGSGGKEIASLLAKELGIHCYENRILTLAWGVLYLLTGLWTFFLMGTPAAPFLTVINNILPVLLGLFTAWFQKWYPAHYAAKAF